MPYVGQNFIMPCEKGGWNASPNVDSINQEDMLSAININLHNNGRETRGGVTKVNATPITSSPKVMSVFQFILENGNTFIVTTTSDGKIQKDYSTVLKSGLSTNKYSVCEVFNNKLYICNGADIPQTWDGAAASTSNLVNVPTDWTGTNYPKGMIKYGRGASEALWAWGCPSNPKALYCSKNRADNFSDAEVHKIEINTGDGYGIVGLFEFGDRLIAVGKKYAYIIDNEGIDRTTWGYDVAQYQGGAATNRLICKTPNDVIVMSNDGNIYSIISTQQYGDYQAISKTRPASLHKWIEDNLDMTKIDDYHMVFDPVLRAVKIFVVENGKTHPDSAMVCFIDRPPRESWVKHAYSKVGLATCSTTVLINNVYCVYTGGNAGHVYKLESTTISDDGGAFYSGFTTSVVSLGNIRLSKRFDRIWLSAKPLSSEIVKSNVWVDGEGIVGGFSLSDESNNYIVDEDDNEINAVVSVPWEIEVSQSVKKDVQDYSYDIGCEGKRIQVEFYNDVIDTKLFLMSVGIDATQLGYVPK